MSFWGDLFKISKDPAIEQRRIENLFRHDNWATMNYGQRLDAMQQLEDFTAAQEGRPSLVVMPETMDPDSYGYYKNGAGCIYINENLLSHNNLMGAGSSPLEDGNIQAFNTVLHEGRHGFEDYAVHNPDKVSVPPDQLKDWALNDGRYFGPDRYSYDHYRANAVEQDAHNFADPRTIEAFERMQREGSYEPGLADFKDNVKLNEPSLSPQELQDMRDEQIMGCLDRGVFYNYGGEMRSVDPGLIRAPNADKLWDQNHLKSAYLANANNIPLVQNELRNGQSLDQIRQDPNLAGCVDAYFNGNNPIRVSENPDGTYSLAGDGARRLEAAKEADPGTKA